MNWNKEYNENTRVDRNLPHQSHCNFMAWDQYFKIFFSSLGMEFSSRQRYSLQHIKKYLLVFGTNSYSCEKKFKVYLGFFYGIHTQYKTPNAQNIHNCMGLWNLGSAFELSPLPPAITHYVPLTDLSIEILLRSHAVPAPSTRSL